MEQNKSCHLPALTEKPMGGVGTRVLSNPSLSETMCLM